MSKPFVALAFAAATIAPSVAHAQQAYGAPPPLPPPPPGYAFPGEPPSNGLGLIITGSIFTGIGGINLLTSPICTSSALISRSSRTPCLALSLGVGIGFLAAGIPMLVVGVGRRNAFRQWKQEHGIIGKLGDIGFTPAPGGGSMTWQTSF
ncbi:hypothetical protein A7982_12802 [Minicystis rosea]|nr:hypothetical protein A7982_12802 [Minicystis rosea]